MVNIFELPQIVVDKVGLEEILTLLRENVNKEYMPSSRGIVSHNSKPEYVSKAIEQFPDYPFLTSAVGKDDVYGSYVSFDNWTDLKKRPIFFYLWIARFIIIINLKTDQAIITSNDYSGFVRWNSPDQKIPIMRDALCEIIETYS